MRWKSGKYFNERCGRDPHTARSKRVLPGLCFEVTEQIDGMVKDLKKEKADDIKQKDYCTEELNKNERPHYVAESAAEA